jgi:hypothetical protein
MLFIRLDRSMCGLKWLQRVAPLNYNPIPAAAVLLREFETFPVLNPSRGQEHILTMGGNNIFYIIGVIVVIAFLLRFLGLY